MIWNNWRSFPPDRCKPSDIGLTNRNLVYEMCRLWALPSLTSGDWARFVSFVSKLNATPSLMTPRVGWPSQYGRNKWLKIPSHPSTFTGEHCQCLQGYGHFVCSSFVPRRLRSVTNFQYSARFDAYPEGNQINGEACKFWLRLFTIAPLTLSLQIRKLLTNSHLGMLWSFSLQIVSRCGPWTNSIT